MEKITKVQYSEVTNNRPHPLQQGNALKNENCVPRDECSVIVAV